MSWQEDLEFNVGRAGHGRLRELCDEGHPEHALHRGAQAAIRARLESLPPPARPPAPPPEARAALIERIRALSEASECPHRRPGEAACRCPHKARCSLYNKDVALPDCVACVAAGLHAPGPPDDPHD